MTKEVSSCCNVEATDPLGDVNPKPITVSLDPPTDGYPGTLLKLTGDMLTGFSSLTIAMSFSNVADVSTKLGCATAHLTFSRVPPLYVFPPILTWPGGPSFADTQCAAVIIVSGETRDPI